METHPCNFPQVCPQVGRKGPGCCGSLSPPLNPHNPQPRLRRRPHAVDSRLRSRTRTPRTRQNMILVTPRSSAARPRHRLQAMPLASSHLIVTFCPRLRNCPGLQPVVDSQEGPSAPLGPWWSPRNPPPHPRPVRAPGTLWVSAWIVRPSRGPARGPGAAGPPAPAATTAGAPRPRSWSRRACRPAQTPWST